MADEQRRKAAMEFLREFSDWYEALPDDTTQKSLVTIGLEMISRSGGKWPLLLEEMRARKRGLN